MTTFLSGEVKTAKDAVGDLHTARLVIGATLLMFSNGGIVTIGNLLPYISSYYFMKKPSYGADVLWISSVYLVATPVGMYSSGTLLRRMGVVNLSVSVTIIQVVFSLASVYSMVSPFGLMATFSLVMGVCNGIIYATCWQVINDCQSDKMGLYSGIFNSGELVGSVVILAFTYLVINPNNRQVDVIDGNTKYFSQDDVTDRVPRFFYMFTIVGGVTLGLGTLLLAWDRTRFRTGPDEKSPLTMDASNGAPHYRSNGVIVCNSQSKEDTVVTADMAENGMSSNSNGSIESTATTELECPGDQNVNKHQADMSSIPMLMTPLFWGVWLVELLIQHTVFVHVNLYKQYGELYLSNDALLTATGIISVVASIPVRLLDGYFVDKFGSKAGLILISSTSAFFMAFIPMIVRVCPIGYIMIVVVEYSFTYLVHMQFNFSIAEYFGPTYFASNIGLVHSSTVSIVLIEPFLLPYLIKQIGWTYVYISATVTSLLALLVSIACLDTHERVSK